MSADVLKKLIGMQLVNWDEDSKEGCQVKDDCLYGTIGKFEWRGVCPDNTEV